MRRNKNLLGMSGALLSTATKSCSPYLLSLGASAAAPSSSPSLFRVRQPSGGGEPGHPPPPILSGPARLAAVALLSLFAVVNLRLADGSERGGFFGDLSLASFGGADGGVGPPRRYIRGVTMRESWIGPSSQPFDQNGAARAAKRLIVVAGHSVTVSGHLEDAGEDERDWFLMDYQRHRGLPQAILAHLRAGIDAAARDPGALLVLSGGQTRATAGPESEGASYYRVADAMNLWSTSTATATAGAATATATGNSASASTAAIPESSPSSTSSASASSGAVASSLSASDTVRARTVSEDFATDSFENFMFSLCRFREVTGSYPESVTVVSFSFKRRRFEQLHAGALQWPPHRLRYVGADPPVASGFDPAEASRGEAENAARPFESDPYGCHSEALQRKRRERNPFLRTAPYALSCPDMAELLSHCGPGLISKDRVPWKDLW